MNFDKNDLLIFVLSSIELVIILLTLYGVVQKPVIEYGMIPSVSYGEKIPNNTTFSVGFNLKNVGNLPTNVLLTIRYYNLTSVNDENYIMQKFDSYTELSLPFKLNTSDKQDTQITMDFLPNKNVENLFIYAYMKGDFRDDVVQNYYTSFNSFSLKGINVLLLSHDAEAFKREDTVTIREFLRANPNLLK